MSQISKGEDSSAAQSRAMPPLTWDGTLTSVAQTTTHYLHLSAFPCTKCNGPVIVGSLGTRQGDISREIDVRELGALCLVCGFRPETAAEPSVQHHFRPVQWNWVIRDCAQEASLPASPLPPELPEGGAKL